ncbi:MAG: DNA cytosine methyltransferase [Clostridium sp.]|jgi:DNA (cytosine-5-)-methyltransferase|nr:DNA cytosine methyltransferase [Clostridium sp.]MDY4875452.1 DNA cytosine methyltransferase [Eubacterium sp.]
MLRLATVFSGIGAIEHALDRMNIEHKIVFACDNGDVKLEMPKIDIDIDAIESELKKLKKKIKSFNSDISDEEYVDYAAQLDTMLAGVEDELNKLREKLKVNENGRATINDAVNETESVLENALEISTASKKKKYKELLKLRNIKASDKAKLFFVLRVALTLDGDGIEYDSKSIKMIVELYNSDIKRLIKAGKDLSERLEMIHDKLFYLDTNIELKQLEDYSERKKFVDNLYAGKESQNKVKQSYMANYDIEDKDFHWNVAFLDGKQYAGQVDLFVGGSPCQSFSLVGKQRGLEDTRGTLFYEYARLVNEIQPKVFIYENVKAILSNDEGRTWEKMKEVFADLGYKVFYTFNGKPAVLNARDYGIPQNRERMFVVGFRNDINLIKDFEFPTPIPLEKKMQDLLLDNVSGAYYLPKKGVDFVTSEKNLTKRYTQIDGEIALCQKKNQQFNWHGDFVFVEENKDMEKTMEDLEKYFLSEKVEKYVMATGTKNFYSRPKTDLEVARPLLTTMHKMHRAGVDNYVHTNGRLRKLTPRECLRLMGFCDSFKIVVSDTSMYQQAGNSIVVDVLIAIMRQIFDSVEENELV